MLDMTSSGMTPVGVLQESHLWMRGQVQAEQVQPHLKEGLDASGADDIGPVQVQEDGANSEHLAGVILQGRAGALGGCAVASRGLYMTRASTVQSAA